MARLRVILFFVVVLVLAFVFFVNSIEREADLVLTGGVIYTVDADGSVAEAVAISGNKIVGVGSDEKVRGRFKTKHLIELQGKAVFPGFIDAHAHLLGMGASLMTLNLVGTTSLNEVVGLVGARAKGSKPGWWIRGRGWDQNDWPVKQFPTHRDLDKVAPNNPIYLVRIDGHASWVNKRVLEIAGITKETEDPPGGRILRDKNGNPTGVLIDNAQALISRFIPEPTQEEVDEALGLAIKTCLKFGLTSVQDMGVGMKVIETYKRFIDNGDFPIRNYVAVGGQSDAWDHYLTHGPEIGYGNNHLSVRSVKLVADGALGSRGAALIEPYSDEPGNRGLTRLSEEEILRVSRDAMAKGFQVCTHAIGDRGNTIVLDAYEKAFGGEAMPDLRFRIEHAQILAESDIPRFKALGVIPSMQPTHCTSDMYWAEARVGSKRIRGGYAWRKLLNTGVIICGGSDVPVESPNPLLGFHAAITREDDQGRPNSWRDIQNYFVLSSEGITDTSAFEKGWYADQKMTREEALKAFTIWTAYGAFEEKIKGSIEVGKLADLVVLSKDIMEVEPKEILNTEVLVTIIGGKIVYERDKPLARK